MITTSARTFRQLLIEALRSGTIASVVMMPFGFFFKWLGLRVGHYGPKLREVLFGVAGALNAAPAVGAAFALAAGVAG